MSTLAPFWVFAAGFLLIAVGIGMGIFRKLMHSTGALNAFVAPGVALIGIFLVVYAVHELRRTHQR